MIGQTKLLNTLNKYTLETLPKNMLFLGEEGCGKRAIITYIKEHFKLDRLDITEQFDGSEISEFQLTVKPTLIVIDLRNFTEKAQNNFLKLIEEPAVNIWVALLANSEIGILQTVLNRSMKFHFDAYSIEELKQFQWLTPSTNDLVYKICRTPGQILNFGTAEGEQRLVETYEYTKYLINNITKLTYSTALNSVLDRVNCKENYNKITFDLFMLVFEYSLYEEAITNKNKLAERLYIILNSYRQEIFRQKINNYLEYTLINMITNMYYEAIK